MTEMYRCDKCGAISDDYEKITRCEESHYHVVPFCDWSDESDEPYINPKERNIYQPGEELPAEVIVKLTRELWTDDGFKTTTVYCKAKLTGKPFGEH